MLSDSQTKGPPPRFDRRHGTRRHQNKIDFEAKAHGLPLQIQKGLYHGTFAAFDKGQHRLSLEETPAKLLIEAKLEQIYEGSFKPEPLSGEVSQFPTCNRPWQMRKCKLHGTMPEDSDWTRGNDHLVHIRGKNVNQIKASGDGVDCIRPSVKTGGELRRQHTGRRSCGSSLKQPSAYVPLRDTSGQPKEIMQPANLAVGPQERRKPRST